MNSHSSRGSNLEKDDEKDITMTGVGDDRYDDKDEYDYRPSFEDVLEHLGVAGRFQWLQIVLFRLPLFVCGFMVLSIVFAGYVPPHRCKHVNETNLITRYTLKINGSTTSSTAHVSYEACGIEISSNLSNTPGTGEEATKTRVISRECPDGRDFGNAKDTTYASEWDLVCESKGQTEFTQTAFTIGQLVGGLVSSPITDYFGRKPVVVTSLCLCSLIEIGHIFSPSIYVVYVIKVLSGMFVQSALTSAFVHSIELVVQRYRSTLIVLLNCIWIMNVLLIGGVAYLVKDMSWRYFHGVSVAFGVFAFVIPFVLKESPRWLMANGRMLEALDVFKHACKVNGKDFQIIEEKFNDFKTYNKYCSKKQKSIRLMSNDSEGGKMLHNDKESRPSSEKASSVLDNSLKHDAENEIGKTKASSPFALLRHRRLVILLVSGGYLWFTVILVYFSLLITSSVLTGDRFLNYTLMALADIPGLLFSLYMMNRMGRCVVLWISLAATAVCLLVSALMSTVGDALPGSGAATTAMFILGKFSISGAFSVLNVITPELFPTNVRSTAHGYCDTLGKIGSMIAPFMRLFHQEVTWGPALLFTLMCSVAVVITLTLPETKGKDLPNTIEDMVNQKKINGNAAANGAIGQGKKC